MDDVVAAWQDYAQEILKMRVVKDSDRIPQEEWDKLKDQLDSILSQYQHNLPIEILISDNSPGLETEKLVAEYKELLPITYIHQPSNIGGARNFMFTVEAAQGSYCWIIGDDDLIINGSITEILDIIAENPTIPAIVCGYAYISEENRPLFRNKSNNNELIQSASVFEDRTIGDIIDCWENTFFLSTVAGLHTFISSCVFQRNLWLQNCSTVAKFLSQNQSIDTDEHEALYSTFPHTIIWGKCSLASQFLLLQNPCYAYFMESRNGFTDGLPLSIHTD
jgi:glycosyltransferase involved in cell wall biosynthesis